MVRHLDINFVFKHPFEKVTRAYFKKYSCGKETNVTAITVLEHKIDPETAEWEYVVRRGECVNVLPEILRKLCPFGKIEVEEAEAWLNKKDKYLCLYCYNLTWSKYTSLEEFSRYRTCENNPDWYVLFTLAGKSSKITDNITKSVCVIKEEIKLVGVCLK
ncbi:PRELI domain-containing protein 2-like isoform X1 [Montipora foliosa]|uniref:PRELI domain-containing protein 2-like isoform X1 n=2 Tax=Montipora foliosa TaxID=591990 RepID=UPI0035F18CB7